jgi:predicted heme/steroid binding protein
MKRIALLTIAALVVISGTVFMADEVQARPQFAQQESKPCGHCHVAAMGGGALTPEGKEFRKTLVTAGERLSYFALYFLHMPFGVAWVGLFFVAFSGAMGRKVLLSPPRQYMRIILYGIVVISVSGPYVAYIRARLTPGFFGTRMGLLLLVKTAAVLALLAATAVLTWHTTVVLSRRYRELEKQLEDGSLLDLTPAEMSLFSGKGKRKALVAVDGKIYDVTERNLWTKGQHPGGHLAGFDLTDAFTDAPHGKEVFERVQAVGTLKESTAGGKSTVRWAFLAGGAASLVILLVVTTWRWI